MAHASIIRDLSELGRHISFKVNPNYVARRVALIVVGSDSCLEEVVIDGERKFSLGGGNHWWMRKHASTNEWTLSHRYGFDGAFLASLRSVIIWGLGSERHN